MESEERYINDRMGRKNPFVVPDGYFDQFAGRVMAQLPERQPRHRVVALRPWLYAAACVVVVLVMSLTLFFSRQVAPSPQASVASVSMGSAESTYMDDAADYVMLDNAEIYACLADY